MEPRRTLTAVPRRAEFTVYGKPITKGDKTMGKTGDGRTFMRERQGSTLTTWMRHVRDEALATGMTWPRGVPVFVTLHFRAKEAPAGRQPGDWCPVPPDGDKLERAVLDALQMTLRKAGPMLADDAQVVRCITETCYGPPLGVHITVTDARRRSYGEDERRGPEADRPVPGPGRPEGESEDHESR